MKNHLLHSRKHFAPFFCLLFYAASLLVFPIQSIAQTRSPQRERRIQIFFGYNPTRPAAQQEVQFLDFSRGTPTSWLWDFGDGETSTHQNPSHTYATPGSFRVSLTARNASSSGKVSRTLNVILSSSASFTFSPSYPITGQAVQFTDSSTGNPTSWQWNFGDGMTSTSQNPSHTYTTAASYAVTLTVAFSSGSQTVSHTISVVPLLAASFTYSPVPPVAGQAVQFMDTSTGSPTSWQWSFGDGATSNSQNPSHTYTTAGAYTVTLTVVYSFGSRSTSQTISVLPPSALSASFTYSPSSPVVGQAVQFTDTSTGGPTSWLWNFGDNTTSTSKNPSHTYATAASYTVTLTVANNSASKSTSQTINVLPASTLTASFTYSPSSPVASQVIYFTDTSTGSPTSWQWNFGDGMTSIAKNPSHTYATAASYTVTLTVANRSASKTISQTVTVVPAITASFTFSPASPAAGQAVQFTDTSIGSPTSWQWNFGDGTSASSQNPSHTYTAAGSYWVNLIITKGTDSHSVSQAITISPASTISASFSYSPTTPDVYQTVYFRDTSTGSPTIWQWDFGDGSNSTDQNPRHVYAAGASYTVKLTASNSSGSNSTSQTVNVISLSAVIPSDRRIDWSRAGVWENGIKGIPNRTTIFCNVKISIPGSTLIAKGDGITDDTAALKAAINACPTGQVVFMPQGTYRISETLNINKGIVVRGAGPASTKIIQYSNNHVFCIFGSSASGSTSVISGYSKGSDTIVVADTANFSVDDLVLIDQLNDPSLVTKTGVEGPCNWCGWDNGDRAMGEILLIKRKNNNTITFNRPLYYNYEATYSPKLYRTATNTLINAGVEDLYIESASTGTDGGGFMMYWCAYCWLKNVESYNIPFKHVEIKWAACGNEVRDSYFHGTTGFSGNHGYGMNINSHSSDNLIENNIFYYLQAPVEIGSGGGAGNVIGYNYIERSELSQPNWFMQHIGTHGAHTYMNLFEGNICGKIALDDTWGSGSHNVFFRNHITGENIGRPVTQVLNAVEIESLNYYITFVGNVLGHPGYVGVVEQIPYKSWENNPVLWHIGYWRSTDTGYPTDPKVAQTLLKTGNWECVTNAVQWTTSVRDIPDSLYLQSKPAWFRDLAWPPFAPERSDFNPNNFNKIPAQIRFGR